MLSLSIGSVVPRSGCEGMEYGFRTRLEIAGICWSVGSVVLNREVLETVEEVQVYYQGLVYLPL